MRTDSDLSAVRWHAGSLNNGLIFGATYHLVTRLPRSCSYAIGHAGTWLAYRLMRDGTRAIVDKLHRIDPETVKADFLRGGFVLDGTSNLLRMPSDDLSKNVFDPAIRGKTDRFVFRFKKPR